MSDPRRALVTGATGYIGSRLVPRLLDEGWDVSVLTRDAGKVADRRWIDRVRVVEGDASSASSLAEAFEGVDVAYYFLHSMDGKGNFVERDRELVQQNAVFSVLSSLLPVLDDIDRAREHEELEGGFKAIADSLDRTVTTLGLTKFGVKGDAFRQVGFHWRS